MLSDANQRLFEVILLEALSGGRTGDLGEMLNVTHVHSLTKEWLPVSSAPSDADLEVCIIDFDGILHALEFPCHKDKIGWFDAMTKKRLDIQPTHWRRWT